jgi:hypothetical protein
LLANCKRQPFHEGPIQFMTSFALPLLGGLVLAGADIAMVSGVSKHAATSRCP